ncbi:MAG TPA: ATP-dependent DNA helicase [Candidatus Saccharimonadales bacterium]|nr:ATP-dependent DNA helicase [Candidatus Saccharimonadales bacterium]
MSDFQEAFQQLNAAQKQAIKVVDGPMLVVAGAGTGKTRVIVERIAQLIDTGITPSTILALTFTEKAAGEMLDRVNAEKTGVTLDSTIATFNGFGDELLRAYGGEYGLGKLRLLGKTGQLVFLREHLDDLQLDYFAPVSNPDGQLEALTDYVSLLKQQLVTPAAYAAFAKKLPTSDEAEKIDKRKHQELAAFFKTYLELCRQHQVIDYDDQIYLTIEMLEARPNILKALHQRYQFIMVDEFQDTNPMQSKLVDLLAGTSQNIMVVGDDDQSIYAWRGATLANILEFKTRYPKAKEIALTENYRSTKTILDAAYRLIQHNNPHRLEVINNIDKRLHGQSTGPEPRIEHFATYDGELAWLADDIKRRLEDGQAPGSIAILARRNQGVEKVHAALDTYDVPHRVAGLGNDMYAQTSVRLLIEALKCVADPGDDLALFHTLTGPLFALDIHQLAKLAGEAKRDHQALNEHAREDENLREALEQIDNWRQAAREQSVGVVAYNIITETGWKQQLYDASEQDAAIFVEVQALAKFFRTLKEFERVASVASVTEYATNLPVLQAAGSQFEDVTLDIADDQVNVLSVHRAKGLEWQTVYIVDCTESSFPLSNFGGGLKLPTELQASPSDADEHMAEERRLMYVAVTRAKQEVILSYADRHGSGATRKPSRFLTELFGHEPSGIAADETAISGLETFAPAARSANIVQLPDSIQYDGRIHLSVSKIETWLRCPQDFYYRYVLNMPLPPAPQLDYGSLIHAVIQQVHDGRVNNNPPALEQLLEEVRQHLPQTGYPSIRSRERSHQQALATVTAVYERFMQDDLPIESEWPFKLELPNIALTISGTIDAVYQTEQGVEIRDFKTGTSANTPQKAKSRVSGSHQLTLYALAWLNLRGEMPAKLTLDFVETGQLASVKKQPKSLLSLEERLQAMVSNLQAGNYPLGRDHSRCQHP